MVHRANQSLKTFVIGHGGAFSAALCSTTTSSLVIEKKECSSSTFRSKPRNMPSSFLKTNNLKPPNSSINDGYNSSSVSQYSFYCSPEDLASFEIQQKRYPIYFNKYDDGGDEPTQTTYGLRPSSEPLSKPIPIPKSLISPFHLLNLQNSRKHQDAVQDSVGAENDNRTSDEVPITMEKIDMEKIERSTFPSFDEEVSIFSMEL
jgi:hypothetical protein